jgi:hypothetical protein
MRELPTRFCMSRFRDAFVIGSPETREQAHDNLSVILTSIAYRPIWISNSGGHPMWLLAEWVRGKYADVRKVKLEENDPDDIFLWIPSTADVLYFLHDDTTLCVDRLHATSPY